jgi:UDP-N-acetylglucosamine acyltransferase
MTTNIHATAIVDPKAEIADGVEIGPYCVVGPHVVLDEGVRLVAHVVVDGRTHVGAGTVVYPFASLGQKPQDLKYKGEPSTLEIGKKNQIREYVTMSPGTEGGGMVTRIGDGGLFMVSVHIGHDCQVGNGVVFANVATLAGHVVVGDYAVIGGLAAVHQFVRIGAHAMIGGMSGVESDVIPYGTVKGERAHLAGLNIVGLERRGFGREEIHALRRAYRMLFASEGTMVERVEDVTQLYPENPLVTSVVDFIRNRANRALCQPRGDAT